MKTVLMTLDAANKQGIAGSEKLTKSDLLILVYVKGKKNISDDLSEAMDSLKAEVEYAQIESNSELNIMFAYLAGFHAAKNHDVFVVTPDKDKISTIVSKNAKVYTSFKSIAGAGSSSSSSGKSTSSGKKSTTKKTTTKKTTTKKSSSKKKEEDLASIFTDLASGKLNKEKLAEQMLKYATKNMK